ncbi:hypothetical protein L6R52_34855, partial [Myxococcota bacterium]|nr:hypothetical protein [Myxococcota bacterium]
ERTPEPGARAPAARPATVLGRGVERVVPNLLKRIPDAPEDRRKKDRAQATLLGEGRIGADDVTSEELASMGSLVAARHLMVLLAKRRADRDAALAHVGALLIGLDDPILVRRLLLELPDAGRIVDIYPLEVLAYVLERRADLVPGFELAPFVTNRAELTAGTFAVEAPIRVEVPLALKMKAFALDGGGTPGYCFAPGAPGEYILELGAAGTFALLLRGDVRKQSLVDRLVLRVEDPPEAG